MHFQALRKPAGQPEIIVKVEDTFIEEQSGFYKLSFLGGEWDIEKVGENIGQVNIEIGIQDLSAWWMGCVSIKDLDSYGEVVVKGCSPEDLDDWFKPRKAPICMTNF